MYYGAKPM